MQTINKRWLPASCTKTYAKKLQPQGLLIELSEPNRSDKDAARWAAGRSIVPARNRAEPNTLRQERGWRRWGRMHRGRGTQVKPSRNSMTHSKDLGANALLPVSVCVFEGLTALSFSCNYLRVGTTANPTRPLYGNTFLPPALSPCANYV